jgi:DNA polymerase-4
MKAVMADRQIIHVDMDAFYASVEQLDNPALAGKAVIVGGDPAGRGVVSAASYEARKFGVHSAMPMRRAVGLCPDAIVLPVRMGRYHEISLKMHEIFDRFTPIIEPISLDEAFLDVTGSIGIWNSSEEIGHAIKDAIKEETHLIASLGIAPNKFLAKLGSDLDKPDGFVIITDQNKQQILDPLPVSRIWGIGKVTDKKLRAHGIETIRQLRQYPLAELRRIAGNTAERLIELACGIDSRPVELPHQAKSISGEHTFAEDIDDTHTLLAVLMEQVEEVAMRLRSSDLRAKTITLKLRYGDFRTVTRSRSLIEESDVTETLWNAAKEVFNEWQRKTPSPLRLIGFAASGLGAGDQRQLSLFADEGEQKQERLDKAVDEIKKRYGKGKIGRKY